MRREGQTVTCRSATACTCLGAALARLETRTALPLLFDRFPDLQFAVDEEELLPGESFISNGHRAHSRYG